ncbi:MAG: signal peptidase II [Verrucomicrobia bacterium]|nr:signal peptidase II [Verrucomicrobiota bacterium]
MNWKKAFSFIALAIVIFFADGALKAYIHHNIPTINASTPIFPYGGISVFRDWHGIDFSIVHVINKGAAWGVFASLQEYLLYARVAIIGGLLTYLIFVKASTYRKFSLMLIATGAFGNVVDYFVYGHVVDMFYFVFWGYSYPVFNIADSAIFLGIMLLLGEALLAKMRSGKSAKKPEARRSN